MTMNESKRYDFCFTYSLRDEEIVSLIRKHIQSKGYSCFNSRNEFSFIGDYAENAINGIRQSNVVVFIITPFFIMSPGCFKEAYIATGEAANYDKLIIPIVEKNSFKELSKTSFYNSYLKNNNMVIVDFNKKGYENIANLIIKDYQSVKTKDQLYDKLNEYIQIDYTYGIVESITSIYSILKKSLFKIKAFDDGKNLSPYIELIDLLSITYKHVNIGYANSDENKLIDKIFDFLKSVNSLIDYDSFYINIKNPTLLRVSIIITIVSHVFDIRQDMINSRTHGDINVPLNDSEAKIRDVLMTYYNDLVNDLDADKYKTKEIEIIQGVKKLPIQGWRKIGEETLKSKTVEPPIKPIVTPISDQLFAIAKYINESNKLFEKLSDENVTFEFLSCLKTSYERLKNYSDLVNCKDVCAYCIDKLAIINQKLDNLSSEDNQEGFKEGAFKALLGLKQPEAGSYDVFISYNHKDEDLAGSIYRFLKSNLISAFYDKVTLPQLGKSEYHDAIMNSLDNSNNFIVVLSDLSYLESHWVDLEMKTFNTELTEGRKEGNFIFIVTDQVYNEIIRSNKKCLPIQYRGYELIRIRDYKDTILSYIKK